MFIYPHWSFLCSENKRCLNERKMVGWFGNRENVSMNIPVTQCKGLWFCVPETGFLIVAMAVPELNTVDQAGLTHICPPLLCTTMTGMQGGSLVLKCSILTNLWKIYGLVSLK